MKFCSECGSRLEEGLKFCPECGTRTGGPDLPAEKKLFELSWSGMMFNSGRTYILTEKNGVNVISVRLEGVSRKDAKTFEVGAGFVRELFDILESGNVASWNGFNKSARNVMDGDRFSFYASLPDGKTVSANGYMSWPEGYGAVSRRVTELFIGEYEKHFPNYRRALEKYVKEELLSKNEDLTDGRQFGFGFISGGEGWFSYGEGDLPEGVAAYVIGNFHKTDRKRADRDMAVIFVKKDKTDDGKTVTGLTLRLYTADDALNVTETDSATLAGNILKCESLNARFFIKPVGMIDDGSPVSLGFNMTEGFRVSSKPTRHTLHLFSFDGERWSVEFSDITDEGSPEQFVRTMRRLGYIKTADQWEKDPSVTTVDPSEVNGVLTVGAFGSFNGFYDKLIQTPKGEPVDGYTVKGYIQRM